MLEYRHLSLLVTIGGGIVSWALLFRLAWNYQQRADAGLSSAATWQLWLILACGLLFISILILYILHILANAASARQLTVGLMESKSNLEKEIAHRRQAENALKLVNENLEAAIGKLSRANQELQDFTRIAAHDLKAPLRAIGTLADWIAVSYSDKLDDLGREQLNLLTARASRMSSLLDAALQYSQIGHDDKTIEDVDLNLLVEEIIDRLRVPDNIRIIVEDRLPTIVCTRKRIRPIFKCLLVNAIKYIDKPQGLIKVGCTQQGGFWKFSIADNGTGIEKKYFDKIFEIFQTLSPRDEVESVGIGLAIVKKAVELHGGRVWVESAPGQGSVFFFTLPGLCKMPDKKETPTAPCN
jgi:light-regulated signal transduction histidine kinase (bacteriophytochrome)